MQNPECMMFRFAEIRKMRTLVGALLHFWIRYFSFLLYQFTVTFITHFETLNDTIELKYGHVSLKDDIINVIKQKASFTLV